MPSTQANFTATRPERHTRTRASSLVSVSSVASLGSMFEISKAHSTSGVSQRPETHEAYGSFIPVRSASSTLKDFVSYYPSLNIRPPKRRRRVTFAIDTFDDRPSSSFSSSYGGDSDDLPSTETPYITRSSLDCPPSPTSSSSSIHSPLQHVAPDLHPILAQLERKSRLCVQVTQCSTCGRPGSDFPRCPRCGDIWCSRPCRLVGGKRHVCSTVK